MAYSPSFTDAVERTLVAEGVFSYHPADSGGATILGIAQAKHPEAYAHVLQQPTFALMQRAAVAFYSEHFWLSLRCDALDSKYVAAEVFDTGVNVGKHWAATFLQRAGNMLGYSLAERPPLRVDGVIGPRTLSDINWLSARYERHLVHALNLFQGMYYWRLYRQDPKRYGQFIRGWMKRLAMPRALLE